MGPELTVGGDQADQKFSELQMKTQFTSVSVSLSFSLQQIEKQSTPQFNGYRKWGQAPKMGVSIVLIWIMSVTFMTLVPNMKCVVGVA